MARLQVGVAGGEELFASLQATAIAVKLRVLLVAPFGSGVGGILSQTNALVAEILRTGTVDIKVIDSTQRYREDGDLRLWRRAIGGFGQAVRITLELTYYCVRFRPHCVEIRSSASLGLARDLVLSAVAKCLRRRAMVAFHFGRIPALAKKRNWEWQALRAAVRLVGTAVVLDTESARALREWIPDVRVVQVPNAVNIISIREVYDNVTRTESDTPRIVFVGMALESKGVIELVQSCAKMDGRTFTLLLVGPIDPDMRVRLTREFSGCKKGSLRILGPVTHPEAVRMIANADIFVLPSHTEAFPVSILEAMACGRAIVATSVGAIPEMLDADGVQPAGVLVAPRDVEALRSALSALVEDPVRRSEYGRQALERCRRLYNIDIVSEKYLEIWRNVADRGIAKPNVNR